MSKIIKYLLFAYLFFVIIKIFLSFFVILPGPYSDYYVYAKIARSFFYFGNFSIHGVVSQQFPPLYPIFISIAYLFKDMQLIFFFIKLINALLSSLIIFPAFFLSKEFLKEKKALLFAILISVLPSNFSFSQYIMAENLFYSLFLFSIYFIYKSFIIKGYKFDFLAGLFIGLSVLTKSIGIVLIPSFFLSAIIYFFITKKLELKKRGILTLTFMVIILLWVIRNGLLFGFKLNGILTGNQAKEVAFALSKNYTIESFITLFIFYLAYYILSSGVFPFILSLTLIGKDIFKKSNLSYFLIIAFSSVLFSLLLMANHNSGRLSTRFPVNLFPWFTGKIIGRYADMVLPLIFLIAFIVIFLYKSNLKKIKYPTIITTLILIFSSQIIFISLLPPNNQSVSWIGFLNIFINYIFYGRIITERFFSWSSLIILTAFFLFLVFFFIHLIKRINSNKILFYLIIIFMVFSLSNYFYNYYYNEEKWINNEQIKLGIWFNDYDSDKISNVLIDIRDKCEDDKNNQLALYCGYLDIQTTTMFGFWMNDNIFIKDVNEYENMNYIVSTHKLNFPVIYTTQNGIYLYKIK